MVKLTRIDEKMVQMILHDYSILSQHASSVLPTDYIPPVYTGCHQRVIAGQWSQDDLQIVVCAVEELC